MKKELEKLRLTASVVRLNFDVSCSVLLFNLILSCCFSETAVNFFVAFRWKPSLPLIHSGNIISLYLSFLWCQISSILLHLCNVVSLKRTISPDVDPSPICKMQDFSIWKNKNYGRKRFIMFSGHTSNSSITNYRWFWSSSALWW